MTAREKLELEHPNKVGVGYIGGCLGCPSDYGYLFKPMYCRDPRYGSNLKQCTDCWDREMPETNLVVGDAEVEHPDTDIPKKNPSCNDLREFAGLPRILDSGNRRQFESGAVRDIQEGKGRCDLLPLDVIAEHLEDSILLFIYQFTTNGKIGHLYRVLDEAPGRLNLGDRATVYLEVSKHFEEGAKKYGENNWQKGIPVHCYIDSAVRHYLKFLRGDKDEPHDRAFCWNIMCAIWTCKHKPELNEYAPKAPKLGYDPVQKAYDIAKSAYNGDQSNIAYALEEIVGYLGEVLE